MAKFEPISGSHAIYEAAMGVEFARELSPAILQGVLGYHEALKDDLPKQETRELVRKIILSPDANVGAKSEDGEELHAVRFSRIKPDGSASWILRADLNEVFVNCLDYTGWDTVWPKAHSYLETIAAPMNDVPVIGIRCQFLDQFVFDGKFGQSTPKELFNENSIYLTAQAAQSAPYWHVHQGWFDESPLKEIRSRVLHQINIDSLPHNGRDVTNISHVMTLQILVDDLPYSALFSEELEGQSVIEIAMQHLHSYNKRVLGDLLLPEMCERIALNPEG